jgi:hypothetical protein
MLTGTVKSKKVAKRKAAHRMWETLQLSLNSSSSNLSGPDDGDNEVCAESRTVPSVGCAGHC